MSDSPLETSEARTAHGALLPIPSRRHSELSPMEGRPGSEIEGKLWCRPPVVESTDKVDIGI